MQEILSLLVGDDDVSSLADARHWLILVGALWQSQLQKIIQSLADEGATSIKLQLVYISNDVDDEVDAVRRSFQVGASRLLIIIIHTH